MKAWLVVNAFMKSAKFDEIYDWLLQAASKKNISMERITNAELLSRMEITALSQENPWGETDKPDFVLFWDKDVKLARLLEKKGLKLFNSADAIAVCDDKSLTHERLIGAGVKMPKTFFSPMTFLMCGYQDLSFINDVEKSLGFPMVVKECFGSFGAQVYLIENHEKLVEKVSQLAGTSFIFQEYIRESCGRDIRINMVGQQVVACMERYNDSDFRANITNGGSMRPYSPKEQEIALARRVMEVLKLDFAGVDILFGENDMPVLCEVNSNAHFKNIYDCTGINVADAIMDYITENV